MKKWVFFVVVASVFMVGSRNIVLAEESCGNYGSICCDRKGTGPWGLTGWEGTCYGGLCCDSYRGICTKGCPGREGHVCQNLVTTNSGFNYGKCIGDDLECGLLSGVCERKKSGIRTPEGEPGTCKYSRDLRSANKSCVVAANNCNMRNGWMPKKLADPMALEYGKDCPNCSCVENPIYEKDKCVASSILTSFGLRTEYYVLDEHNFCSEGKKPEVWGSERSGYIVAYCRCIDKNAEPSWDYVGDDLMSDLYEILKGMDEKNINGSLTSMFCEPIDEKNPKINTAIGCIPVSVGGFISWIIPNLMGVVGGISFLIMVYGFIMIATSEGDPKKAQAAKETITAAITGLILSIFAIFLVRLIMLYVLKLPGVK